MSSFSITDMRFQKALVNNGARTARQSLDRRLPSVPRFGTFNWRLYYALFKRRLQSSTEASFAAFRGWQWHHYRHPSLHARTIMGNFFVHLRGWQWCHHLIHSHLVCTLGGILISLLSSLEMFPGSLLSIIFRHNQDIFVRFRHPISL